MASPCSRSERHCRSWPPAVSSALKGETEIGFGNVIGSNVFNTMAVMGIAGLVGPVKVIPGADSLIHIDFPIVIGFSVAMVVLPVLFRGEKARGKAAFLLLGYVTYTAYLLLTGRDVGAGADSGLMSASLTGERCAGQPVQQPARRRSRPSLHPRDRPVGRG